MARWLSLPAAVIALCCLAACATPQTDRVLQRSDGLPAQAELPDVRFFPQAVNECGPAALAMALHASGIAVTPEELTPLVFTPGREGSLQPDMITATRRHGRVAYPIKDLTSLLREVAAGTPVVVFQNLGLSWYPQWHYAVAIGYDLDSRELILHSGETARTRLSLATFEHTWERGGHWAILALPPNHLPATAEPLAYLTAVKGLEQAKQFAAAERAYATALGRWPDDLLALMGRGNALYALGRKRDAASAFRAAVARHPDSGAALNNLAHVLADLGQYAEAERTARRALELGGPFSETARRTLDEIRAKGRTARVKPPSMKSSRAHLPGLATRFG